MNLFCQKGCMDPMPPIVDGQPFPLQRKATKYGPHCQCSKTRPYAPRRPKRCRIHYRPLFGPGCDCIKWYLRGKRTAETARRCAAGCVTPEGKRTLDGKLVIPGISMHLWNLLLLKLRTQHADSRRFARAMDRELPPPVPSVYSIPIDELIRLPFELRASMRKAEKRATDQSNSVVFAVGRARLLDFVDLRYQSDATRVLQPAYRNGPLTESFDLWSYPIFLSESGPSKNPSVCGKVIDLRKVSSDLVWNSKCSSFALMETKLRRAFDELICGHLREHMNTFGLDFDSNVRSIMQGIGLSTNNCRALVIYVPPLFR
ncbi:hypothetical protein K438DRAFT_1778560 [Mycena galopus ATCC 62051]|nr:hypothetical protein K438DRAFT_1778560 [Mycena galopus ATCC 62051]